MNGFIYTCNTIYLGSRWGHWKACRTALFSKPFSRSAYSYNIYVYETATNNNNNNTRVAYQTTATVSMCRKKKMKRKKTISARYCLIELGEKIFYRNLQRTAEKLFLFLTRFNWIFVPSNPQLFFVCHAGTHDTILLKYIIISCACV